MTSAIFVATQRIEKPRLLVKPPRDPDSREDYYPIWTTIWQIWLA
jgi:hypothetical protein